VVTLRLVSDRLSSVPGLSYFFNSVCTMLWAVFKRASE